MALAGLRGGAGGGALVLPGARHFPDWGPADVPSIAAKPLRPGTPHGSGVSR